jgi:glycine cleavage system H protein
MNIPTELKYTESNEWVQIEGKIATFGITDFAQDQLSDIVFAEVLVAAGDEIKKGDSIATIESVKAAADVYSPISGKVMAVNEELGATPEVINSSPYGEAWMIKIEFSDTSELSALLDASTYQAHCESQH